MPKPFAFDPDYLAACGPDSFPEEAALLDSFWADGAALESAWESCDPRELSDILTGLGFESETANRAAYRASFN